MIQSKDLLIEIRTRGFQGNLFAIEAAARGFESTFVLFFV